MDNKILVTCALPYANGPLHLGHTLEFTQGDIFVRFQRMRGKDIIFCCADDTHGTPIEINAAKQGITPEKMIEQVAKEHIADLKALNISLDSFYSTNSKENKELADLIFTRAREKGFIYTKDVELTYCEKDARFLPDRYVKGECPKCHAQDQYGDVCEKCGATYATTDLINPYCVLCKTKPTRKKSMHYFFKLSEFSDKLKKYIEGNKQFQPEIRNYLLNWIAQGLEDWDISRDGPYFGFKIPGEENKFFYVWVDAPCGYISSTWNACNLMFGGNRTWESYWKAGSESSIYHIIGKDIIYFHYLFWPAMLLAADLQLPTDIPVHGFITVNGEKMSKSRGTFLYAREYLAKHNPDFLRYYYGANLIKANTDIDLNFNEMKEKVNAELIGNIANFAYRNLSFLNAHFGSKLSEYGEPDLEYEINKKIKEIGENYGAFNFRDAVKLILEISSLGNKYMQDNAPWKTIKENAARAHSVVSFNINLTKKLALLLYPVTPSFSRQILKQLNCESIAWKELDVDLPKGYEVGKGEIVLQRIESFDLILPSAKAEEKKETADPFSSVDLRVARIESVENHPDADKLYVLQLDLGPLGKRQLVAGMRPFYTQEGLLGKRIVVIANLEPAKIRGKESQGMMLAGEGPKDNVGRLFVESSEPGTKVVVKGIASNPKPSVSFKEFIDQVKIEVSNGKVVYKGTELQTETGENVRVERVLQGIVR